MLKLLVWHSPSSFIITQPESGGDENDGHEKARHEHILEASNILVVVRAFHIIQ